MKKVTFPHMGNLKIPVKAFFQAMGVEVILPPKNSKKTLDLGVKYSPEFACLPLKINMGNFIEALDKGADTIVMGGGCGPCRFGYYGEVQKEILQELGYQFKMIVLEPNLIEDYRQLRQLFGGISLKKIYRAGRLAWNKVLAMDEVYKYVLFYRAREKKEGQVDKIYQQFLLKLDQIMSIEKVLELKTDYLEKIKECAGELKRGIEIKIGIVGEIYLVLESFTNLEVEKKLGQLGATIVKEVSLSNWLYHFLNIGDDMELIKKAAEPYLKSFVGGHGINTVGDTVRFARQGIDGVIQVAPFTCMPEIVAQTILPVVAKEEKLSVLSLYMDEHSADAGLITRLEAFVDLLIRKKTKTVKV